MPKNSILTTECVRQIGWGAINIWTNITTHHLHMSLEQQNLESTSYIELTNDTPFLLFMAVYCEYFDHVIPDSKVHEANMGPMLAPWTFLSGMMINCCYLISIQWVSALFALTFFSRNILVAAPERFKWYSFVLKQIVQFLYINSQDTTNINTQQLHFLFYIDIISIAS